MKKIAMFGIMALATGMAFAGEATSSVGNTGVSVKAGLNGVGFDVTQSFSDKFKIRAGYSEVKVNKTYDQDDVNYDGKLKLGGFDLLADYHPFASGFRVTGGAYVPTTKFNAKAKYTAAGVITLNDTVYTSADVNGVQADVKWNKVRPYLGLGYDGFNKTTKGVYFTADVGVIFAGKPTVNVNGNCVSLSTTVCSNLNRDIAAETASIRDDLDSAKWLPVVQVGLGYRF